MTSFYKSLRTAKRTLFITCIAVFCTMHAFGQTTVYVDATAGNDNNTGAGWGTAYKTLSYALTVANTNTNVKNILLVKGTYYPVGTPGATTATSDSAFVIQRNGIRLYGGYDPATGQRNTGANKTYLDGNNSSFHILAIAGIGAGDSVIIDGLTIRNALGGNAATLKFYNNIGFNSNEGGGAAIKGNSGLGGALLFKNCAFINNNSNNNGPAVYNNASSPTFVNCLFADNSGRSGTMFSYDFCSPVLINCTFTNNDETQEGAAITNFSTCKTTLKNCIIWGNTTAAIFTNADANSSETADSYSIIQGGLAGGQNVNPSFNNGAANGDYTLAFGSPAIDGGSNSLYINAAPGSDKDLNGNTRLAGITIDMGAYENNYIPAITSFTPLTAAGGATVTISGNNFSGPATVKFGGADATNVQVVNPTTITAVVGTRASGKVTVTTPAGTATSTGNFTWGGVPSITSFTPATSGNGLTVTITGTNFYSPATVSFGGTDATDVTIVDANTITATVGSGASGKITVTTQGGTTTSTGDLTWLPAPSITSFSPAQGGLNSVITITGANFTAPATVTIGGVAATNVTIVDAGTITATAGTGGTGAIEVTTAGGTARSSQIFIWFAPPTSITYGTSDTTLAVNVFTTANWNPSVNGFTTSYSISPALPAGLEFDSRNGNIDGRPTTPQPSTPYTITATGYGGNATTVLNIAVAYAAPVVMYLSGTDFTFNPGEAGFINGPFVQSGQAVSFSVSPALPAGFNIDAATGRISGTPTTPQALKSYTVKATNATGSTSSVITITINPIAPNGLAYSNTDFSFDVNVAITPLTPSLNSNPAASFRVSPALPAGLKINAGTGGISGTPTTAQPSTLYYVIASNYAGVDTAIINIAVIYTAPPTNFSYNSNSNIFYVNSAITPLTPTITGTVTTYTISPALPAGLNLDPATGIISGTPTAVDYGFFDYTITATNTGGSASTDIYIGVRHMPPGTITYTNAPFAFTKGSTIALQAPVISGGAVSGFFIHPDLPSGLFFDYNTGIISGTPTAISSPADYKVSAFNESGNSDVTISIAVNDVAPSGLAYGSSSYIFNVNSPVNIPAPIASGGAVTGYTISPALPAGLIFDAVTGAITGTPTTTSAATDYTITASNSGGSTNVTVNITVNPEAPSGLSYPGSPFVFKPAIAITQLAPSVSGGAVTAYSITPALPAGLAFDAATGIISGTPGGINPSAQYTIMATNGGGSTTVTIDISVSQVPPSGLSYPGAPFIFNPNITITPAAPSISGDAVTAYSITPALPTGLVFDATTGIISGTPQQITAGAQTYTVTATNYGGTTTVTLQVTVQEGALSSISYTGSPFSFTTFLPVTPVAPVVTGGTATGYSLTTSDGSPLPDGLAFDNATGIISGTPTQNTTAPITCTITASNSTNSVNTTIQLQVTDAPPMISYDSFIFTFNRDQAVNLVPNSFGGPVTAYSVSPALPYGLMLDASTGIISGTPVSATPEQTYTITASNSGGAWDVFLDITVVVLHPAGFSYATPPVFAKNTAITPLVPTIATSTVTTTLGTGIGHAKGIAVTANDVYVADDADKTVKKISKADGTTTTVAGGFTSLSDITADAAGNVFVADADDASYTTIAANGTVTKTSIGIIHPGKIGVDAAGNVYLYDAPDGSMFRVPVDGKFIPYPNALPVADAMAVSPGGDVYFIVSGFIMKVLPDGSTTYIAGRVNNGTAMLVNAAGDVYVYDQGASPASIQKVNVDGSTTTIFAPANTIGQFAFDATGSIYVADATNGSAEKITTPGSKADSYTINPALPAGLAIDAQTGVISGTPTQPLLTTYTVTASNQGGNTIAPVQIIVKDNIPLALAYPGSPFTFGVNTPVTPQAPSITGGPVASYSISPALPAGLGLNVNTGKISGLPQAAVPQIPYTITATGIGEQATAVLLLEVKTCIPVASSTPVTICASALPYNWNGSSYTKAGTYTLHLTSAESCDSAATLVLTVGKILTTATLRVTGASNTICYGGAKTIIAAATGGTAPYQYSLDGTTYQASPNFTVHGGDYTVTVKDTAGCTLTTNNVSIIQPVSKLKISGLQPNTDGSITVNATGGYNGYTYSANGTSYQPSNIFAGLAPGTTITVKDLGGCTATSTLATLTAAVRSAANNNNICYGGSKTIFASATGGFAPYQYSLNGGAYQASGNFVVKAGTHNITARDATGATAATSITMVQPAAKMAVPTFQLFGPFTAVNETGGFGGYNYSLNGGAYESFNIFPPLAAGDVISVKDLAGCAATATFTALSPTLKAAGNNYNVCYGSSRTIITTAAGGFSPYQYSLNGGAYQATGSFVVPAGTYSVSVKDAAGTIVVTNSVTITQPAVKLSVTLTKADVTCNGAGDGVVTAAAAGGYSGYLYSTDSINYQSSGLFSNLPAGAVKVYTRDALGCNTTKTVTITQPATPCSSLSGSTDGPTSASAGMTSDLKVKVMPNPTITNFVLTLQGGDSKKVVEIRVMNMLGKGVYHTVGSVFDSYTFGQSLPSGIYIAEVLNGTQAARVKLVKGN